MTDGELWKKIRDFEGEGERNHRLSKIKQRERMKCKWE